MGDQGDAVLGCVWLGRKGEGRRQRKCDTGLLLDRTKRRPTQRRPELRAVLLLIEVQGTREEECNGVIKMQIRVAIT
jgi:hypothetical protein